MPDAVASARSAPFFGTWLFGTWHWKITKWLEDAIGLVERIPPEASLD